MRELGTPDGEIVETQLAAGTVPWVVDVRCELGDALAVTHKEELATLDRQLLEALRPLSTSIPRGRWESLGALTKQVGVDLPPDVVATVEERDEPAPLACLAGKDILLYSLRERAARQAAARLREVDGVEVTLSHEHAGSTRLAGQVKGADLVVIVTAAAKHAATNFIEDEHPAHLVRVNSAGMSAILMALEEECETG